MLRFHHYQVCTMQGACAALLLVLAAACKPVSSRSYLTNIYSADDSTDPKGNGRRHPASSDEAIWTVQSANRGCSGILIDRDVVLSSYHCRFAVGDTLRSGWAVYTKDAEDLLVTQIVESSPSDQNDYVLLQVSWQQIIPPQQKYPPLLATSAADLTVDAQADRGDVIFTVGFPRDKAEIWRITYSEGQAKALGPDGRLKNNIGVIDGNSGGGIIKWDNGMLVGLVKGGPKAMAVEGWNQNNLDAAAEWNTGIPLWSIYKDSQILPKIYPMGRHYTRQNEIIPQTQIFLGVDAQANELSLWATAGQQTETLVLCPLATMVCSASSPEAQLFEFKEQKGDRRFFQLPASPSSLKAQSFQLAAYSKSETFLAKRRFTVQQVQP